jgi:formylmethanofuran dehydrogenase subunit E
MTDIIASLFEELSSRHKRVCPRQVLGLRMGLYAGELLEIELPQRDKRLLVIAETDGCALDGISLSTGCCAGRRTLRIEDYGKVAASFIDTHTGCGLRLSPRPGCREGALLYAPAAPDAWHAQRLGYQHMPAGELFSVQAVELSQPLEKILGAPGLKASCTVCGEEVINGRQVSTGTLVLCLPCSGISYYYPIGQSGTQ